MGVGYEAIEVIKKGFNSNFSSEREFRERVIGRLLEYLGWNSDGDVQYEYAIPIATTTLRVDYLVGHSQPFALEAKQPNVDISPGSSPWNQILDYLKLDKTIRYGVLYNGKALYIMRGGMERPLVSWISQYDFSAFEYLKKSSYPSLLDLEVFLGNTDIKSRTDLTNSISKFQGRNVPFPTWWEELSSSIFSASSGVQYTWIFSLLLIFSLPLSSRFDFG